jgi:hypothetical protein
VVADPLTRTQLGTVFEDKVSALCCFDGVYVCLVGKIRLMDSVVLAVVW